MWLKIAIFDKKLMRIPTIFCSTDMVQDRKHCGAFRQPPGPSPLSRPHRSPVLGFLFPGRPFSRPASHPAPLGRFSGCKMLSNQGLRGFHEAVLDKIPVNIRKFVGGSRKPGCVQVRILLLYQSRFPDIITMTVEK